MKHTPAPWSRTELEGKHTIWGNASVVCQTQTSLEGIDDRLGSPTNPETAEANAKLLEAAPEMLEALMLTRGNVSSLYDSHPRIWGEWLKVIDEAIAKATV